MHAGALKAKVVFVSCGHQLLAASVAHNDPERIFSDCEPCVQRLSARLSLLGKVLGVNGLRFFQSIQNHNPIACMGLCDCQRSPVAFMTRHFVSCYRADDAPGSRTIARITFGMRDTLIPFVHCF